MSVVLVVEDDIGVQELLLSLLKEEGYEGVAAEDGLVALEKFAAVKPDLILLDLMLPRMDGYTFVEVLEQRGWRAAIPIIVLTAYNYAEGKATQVEADGYLAKPFDIKDLLEILARFLPQP